MNRKEMLGPFTLQITGMDYFQAKHDAVNKIATVMGLPEQYVLLELEEAVFASAVWRFSFRGWVSLK